MWPSVAVFSRGRAVWSPWETETVEPAFGTYHFIQGAVVTDSTIKRLLFPLVFVWTLKLSFILDILMIKKYNTILHPVDGYFFQTWDSGSIRNGGTEVRDGKIFSQVKCRTSSALCVFVFKNVHLTAHFLPSHQETIEVESENVFKLAAFALQVRKCVVGSLVWILSANVNEDKARFELLSFGAAAYQLLSRWFPTRTES